MSKAQVEDCAEEGASEGVTIMDVSVDIGLCVNELFALDWQPCNSFSTIISSLSVITLNKSQISLYIMLLSQSCGCGESAGCDMVSGKIENNTRWLAISK
jgi:hypothetical protein